MTRVIRIPKRFYDDCEDCGTGTPPIVRTTKAHYFVDIDCAFSLLEDFTSRAGVYQDSDGFDEYVLPICESASATLAALAKEQDWIDAHIVGKARDRLAVVQENIDDLYDCSDTSLSVVCAPEFRWEADMKMYQRDKRQLTQFIKKWGDKS